MGSSKKKPSPGGKLMRKATALANFSKGALGGNKARFVERAEKLRGRASMARAAVAPPVVPPKSAKPKSTKKKAKTDNLDMLSLVASATLAPKNQGEIVLLTRAEHVTGAWMRELIRALEFRGRRVALVHVDACSVADCSDPPKCAVVVNRVSDAAPPHVAKRTMALLRDAELCGVPCLNGSGAYAVGANKVLHHRVIERAGYTAPRSASINMDLGSAAAGAEQTPSQTGEPSRAFQTSLAIALAESSARLDRLEVGWPRLVKPNAGGFGAGIELLHSFEQLTAWGRRKVPGGVGDGTFLLQEYIPPRNGEVFRVWFLGGRVQCAVRQYIRPDIARLAPDNPRLPGGAEAPSMFGGGCVSGACSFPVRTTAHGAGGGAMQGGRAFAPGAEWGQEAQTSGFRAWAVPERVGKAVLAIAAKAEATCGSVELLYREGWGDQAPVFFDVNMLSTLPLMDGSVLDPDRVWPPSFRPYEELADYIIALAR